MQSRSLGALTLSAMVLAWGGLRAAEESGYLGVALEEIPEAVAAHLGVSQGVMVADVAPASPAEKAGLRKHDIIVSVGGEAIKGRGEMREKIRAQKPGSSVQLGVRRGAETLDLTAVLAAFKPAEEAPKVEKPADADKPADKPAEKPEAPKSKRGFLGIGFSDVPQVLADHLGLGEGAGVLVGDVWKDSPAKSAGIEKDDVLVALDGYEVKGPADFTKLMAERKVGEKLKVDVIHRGAKKTLDVTLGERPAEASAPKKNFFYPGAHGWNAPRPDQQQFFWEGPGIHRKGRVVIEGPEGRSYTFEVPDGVWKVEDLARDFQGKMQEWEKEFHKDLGKWQVLLDPADLSKRIQQLSEELDSVKSEGDEPGATSVKSSQVSVLRQVSDGYDITVTDNNGDRSVTVKKGDETLAQKLPYDKLDTLPKDVQERVESIAKGLHVEPHVIPPPAAKIKA